MTLSDEMMRLLMDESLPVTEVRPLPLRFRAPRFRAIPPPWQSEPLPEDLTWLFEAMRDE